MGRKKRASDPPPAKEAAAAMLALAAADHGSVKAECERALLSLRRGNHNKALRVMKEATAKYGDSALLHRVHGTVHAKLAALLDDPAAKRRHLRAGAESACRAAELSPDSIEYAHFHAGLLYEVADDGEGYEDAVRECERGMRIENPIDPAKDGLNEVGQQQQRLPTAEARVEHFRQELQSLVQKANIASLSSWMKNIGTLNGEDRFRLVPFRRLPEDPIEMGIAPARRPNEIKKAVKTPEDRRKEIEVRVAAARLLQQQAESINAAETEAVNVAGNGGEHRSSERRKSAGSRKSAAAAGGDRMELVRKYWGSMTSESRRGLLKVRVEGLLDYFASGREGLPLELLTEALRFGESNRRWRFWDCCSCEEKFTDSKLLREHLAEVHIDSLSSQLQLVMPRRVDPKALEMLISGDWKPIDTFAALKMLEGSDILLEEDDGYLADTNMKDGSDEEWEASAAPAQSALMDTSCEAVLEVNEQVEESVCVEEVVVKRVARPQSWPLADDVERGKLLEKIHGLFQYLVRENYLAASHLDKIMQFSLREINSFASGSQLVDQGLDRSPICICFLGPVQLRFILKFLQDISRNCVVERLPEVQNIIDEKPVGRARLDVVERIVFANDSAFLFLDDRSLSLKIEPKDADDDIAYDDSNPAVSLDPEDGKNNEEDILTWLYDRTWSAAQLQRWTQLRREKTHQGLQLLQMLKKEFLLLQTLCETKCEHLSYEESMQAIEFLCLEELKKRDESTISFSQSYETVLKKRHEELVEMDNNLVSASVRFELEILSTVLKEAQAISMSHFGYNESSGTSSGLCDLECGEDEGWREQEYLHQSDSCIEIALQRQRDKLDNEFFKVDGRILRSVATMQQLELKFIFCMTFDYREVILPFMKSFIQTQLEFLVDKDATDRSDAVGEALLAELARDTERNFFKGGDQSKQVHEKSKDKKKNKDNRKTKSLKGSGVDEHAIFLWKNDVDDVAESDDSPGSFHSVSVEDLKLQEEIELKSGLEEEKKLEETLEYQRRIENETKRRHFAAQNKEAAGFDREELLADLRSLPDCQKSHQEPFVLVEGSIGEHYKDILEHGISSPTEPVAGHGNRQSFTKFQYDENGTIIHQQLQKKDDDENFQAEIEMDVQKSLDALNLEQKKQHDEDTKFSLNKSPKRDDLQLGLQFGSVFMGDTLGTGLQNEVGEYNCFLNVIIQSLWNLRRFRDEFLKRPKDEHRHVGVPCVVCALYEIFTALSVAFAEARGEAVAPTSLRVALSNLYPESNFFQQAQMNDASEVLAVVFDCLHRACTSIFDPSNAESGENNREGSWDCKSETCIAHTLFGMNNSEQMSCSNCGRLSRHLKYTSFFHNINANALRKTKAAYPNSSIDELLKKVELNYLLPCDPDSGGCGKMNCIRHFITNAPDVFTTVIGWQNSRERFEDISNTLAAITTDLNFGVLYRGLYHGPRYSLVSVVCYYGQHYHCFAYNHNHEQWVMYDDKTVKAIGRWEEVVSMCEQGCLQPQVLFYEVVS